MNRKLNKLEQILRDLNNRPLPQFHCTTLKHLIRTIMKRATKSLIHHCSSTLAKPQDGLNR